MLCRPGTAQEGTVMKVNYHSHTSRCHHATGTQREFVEKAIEAGFEKWGFSDHTPHLFPDGYVSAFRMLPTELEGYVRETLDLKKEYQKDIEIHLGLEVEYYPRHFESLLRLCEGYPIEYFLLAQHCLDNEYDGCPSGRPTEDEAVLAQYCRQIYEAMNTGRFLYLAHPDLINYTGPEEIYDRHMRELCRQAKAHHLPLEINFLGLNENRNYPDQRFWKIVGEEQADVVFGVDAHHINTIHLPGCEERALKMVQKYGLHLLEDVLPGVSSPENRR